MYAFIRMTIEYSHLIDSILRFRVWFQKELVGDVLTNANEVNLFIYAIGGQNTEKTLKTVEQYKCMGSMLSDVISVSDRWSSLFKWTYFKWTHLIDGSTHRNSDETASLEQLNLETDG